MAAENYSDSETSTLYEETGTWLKLAALSAWLVVGAVSLLLALSNLAELPLLHSLLAPLQAHVPSEKALYSPIAYFILFSLVNKKSASEMMFVITSLTDLTRSMAPTTCPQAMGLTSESPES